MALERPVAEESTGTLQIAVARLPYIANFDDFDLLATEPSVRLRYVDAPDQIVSPDLIILAGSKSTAADLQFLRASGMADRIVALAQSGTPVLGICAGYQMLGERICDPLGIESSTKETPGLGLLPATTTFLAEKRTRRVRARPTGAGGPFGRLAGTAVDGYEIHMGVTEAGDRPLFSIADGEDEHPDGCRNATGTVAGTYLHGLFEAATVRRSLVDWLAARRGLSLAAGATPVSRQAEYDRLATAVRESLDLRAIARLAGLEG